MVDNDNVQFTSKICTAFIQAGADETYIDTCTIYVNIHIIDSPHLKELDSRFELRKGTLLMGCITFTFVFAVLCKLS